MFAELGDSGRFVAVHMASARSLDGHALRVRVTTRATILCACLVLGRLCCWMGNVDFSQNRVSIVGHDDTCIIQT